MNLFRIRQSVLALGASAILLALAGPAVAAGPVTYQIDESFVDINPCTGELHTIFVTGTVYSLDVGNGLDYRIDRVVTTSSGFSGGGHEEGIHNRIFRDVDILTNADGDIIMANARWILDPSGTVHVDTFALTCHLRP